MMSENNKDFILLVCSSGGHFIQLYEIWKGLSKEYNYIWISFNTSYLNQILEEEKIIYAYSPTNRNIINLFKNSLLAIKLFIKFSPKLIISTGAGISIPFFVISKIFNIKSIYIESLARINNLSMTGKVVYYFANSFIVQWKKLNKKFNNSIYIE